MDSMMDPEDPFVDRPQPDRMDPAHGLRLLEAARDRVRESPWMQGVDFGKCWR